MEKYIPQGPTYYSEIDSLVFYVLGDEENLIESNVYVSNKEVMKGDRPMIGGVSDPHMGTTDNSWNCATCGNRKTICPGHFGSTDLKYPVKSPLFRDELLKWLKITCYYCGAIVVEPKKHIEPNKILSELVKSVKSVKECPKCKKQHLQVVKDKRRSSVFYRITDTIKYEYFNHLIERTVQKIRDEDVIKLHKPLRSHPKKFVLRTIKIPPNNIRPDIRRVGGSRSSNSDTTSLLKTIIEINSALPDDIPETDKISQDLIDMYFNLDITYYTMLKGSSPGDIKLVTNTSKPPVAIAERFPSKGGRIRLNLMGKRVEYMIRSVITGDSRLQIHEVGIPKLHARNLEIPEYVNERNIDRLKIYFTNKNRYPGCKRIIKKSDSRMYRVEHMDPNYQLQPGDIVLRDIITGDVVDFNRQPSLLFSNISAMKVVVMDVGDTLRINPSVCNYFNADFDGDQMNAIVNQDIMARVESSEISKVARWLISPQKQAPLVGAFQDGLTGIVEFTKYGVQFDKWHAMQMFSSMPEYKNINLDFNKKIYTNRDLISNVLPKINLSKTPSIYREEYAALLKYNPEDIHVKIVRGKLQSGIMDKSICGQSVKGSIIHIIANEYGNDYALKVVYYLQQLIHQFMYYHGYTTGVMDINISNEAKHEIKNRISRMILESRKITNKLNSNKLIAPLGMSLKEYYENEQQNALAMGDDFITPIFADIDLDSNSMARMILTGAKGKPPNFIAINGAIGNQTINGKRFPYQAGWGRTSPFFVRYDTEPAANGYIANSYNEGISNDVYPFAAGEARFGQISIAMSTSITGYQNRISIKNLETIIVDNLRKSSKAGNITQLLYGECGIDPSKTEKVKYHTVLLSDEEFKKQYLSKPEYFNKKYRDKNLTKLLNDEFRQLTKDRQLYRDIYLTMEKHNPHEYILNISKQSPVNIYRIIEDTVYNYPVKKGDLDPYYVVSRVRDLTDNIAYCLLNDIMRKKKAPIPKYLKKSTTALNILLRSYLSTSWLVKKQVTNQLLDIIIDKVVYTYSRSLIEYGSSVGIIAAQCVSEPLTQFVLDSKHRSGGQGGTKTNEIVRIKEIFGAKETENMKNTHMLIMVKHQYENNKVKVQEIANYLEMIKFKRFIKTTMVFFEEYGKPTHPDFKHEANYIKEIEKHNLGRKPPSDLAKWCIRFSIDKEELILKSMELETIIISIQKTLPILYIIYTPETADEIFIRCYIKNSQLKQTNNYYEDNIVPIVKKIQNVIVRGIDGIISTDVVDCIVNKLQPDNSLVRQKIYGIATTGTNIVGIAKNKYVDIYRTQSDSIKEIERIYGAIAARNKIMNELSSILKGLSPIHCSVFADEMVYTGEVTSIQRTGLQKREPQNHTLQMSFQNPIQVLQNASINGMVDQLNGISAKLIAGTNPRIGTTFNRLVVDESFINKNMKDISDQLDDL